VPEVSSGGGDGHPPLIESQDQRRAYVESYRNLRSAILFLAPAQGQRPRLLLIASAAHEEGKSTVAANLARVLAMGGSRVLLIDADLRGGSLHERLGMERLPGLSDALCDPNLLARAIQSPTATPQGAPGQNQAPGPESGGQPELFRPAMLPNLCLLARGGDVNEPSDLFLSSALDDVLARLPKRFDYALIDSRPVFAADDVSALAPKADGTLLVVRNGYSHFGQVRSALELLYQRRAKVLGIVVNRADARAGS
jgi:Mrp family chromosome partitioning ATPase